MLTAGYPQNIFCGFVELLFLCGTKAKKQNHMSQSVIAAAAFQQFRESFSWDENPSYSKTLRMMRQWAEKKGNTEKVYILNTLIKEAANTPY